MQVTNNTGSGRQVGDVSVPAGQTRNVRGWDELKQTAKVRRMLDDGDILTPEIDPSDDLVAGNAKDIIASIPSRDDETLAEMLNDERAGKNRSTVTDAIESETEQRDEF